NRCPLRRNMRYGHMPHAAQPSTRWPLRRISNSLSSNRAGRTCPGRIEMTAIRMPRAAAVAATLAALAGAAAQAEDAFPTRSMRMIVSFSAGGPTDIVARVMGARMGELLGQQIIVENRTGAGGNLGADYVAKQKGDAYTMLMATVSTHAFNPGLYKHMPYDPVRDFTPLGRVGVTPTLLAVTPSLPVKDLAGLLELIKANPGKYTYGSSGLGSILHLCGEEFRM